MTLHIGRPPLLHPGDTIHATWIDHGHLAAGWVTVTDTRHRAGAVHLTIRTATTERDITLGWNDPVVIAS